MGDTNTLANNKTLEIAYRVEICTVTPFLHLNLLYYQVEMSSSLSGEITNTRAKTKRNVRLFHVGRKGKFSHSSAKSILMAERASSFLGTKNIERFTKKLCRII